MTENKTIRPSWFDPKTTKVLWAAMCSMVMDVHAPQDNLTQEEWEHAAAVFDALNVDISKDQSEAE